jgi:hypothetical protein
MCDLIDNPHPDPLGIFGTGEDRFHRLATLKVAVTCNAHEYGALGWGAVVAAIETARTWIGDGARSDLHGRRAGHEFIVVDGAAPELRQLHGCDTVAGMDEGVVTGQRFRSQRDRPRPGWDDHPRAHVIDRAHSRWKTIWLLLLSSSSSSITLFQISSRRRRR